MPNRQPVSRHEGVTLEEAELERILSMPTLHDDLLDDARGSSRSAPPSVTVVVREIQYLSQCQEASLLSGQCATTTPVLSGQCESGRAGLTKLIHGTAWHGMVVASNSIASYFY